MNYKVQLFPHSDLSERKIQVKSASMVSFGNVTSWNTWCVFYMNYIEAAAWFAVTRSRPLCAFLSGLQHRWRSQPFHAPTPFPALLHAVAPDAIIQPTEEAPDPAGSRSLCRDSHHKERRTALDLVITSIIFSWFEAVWLYLHCSRSGSSDCNKSANGKKPGSTHGFGSSAKWTSTAWVVPRWKHACVWVGTSWRLLTLEPSSVAGGHLLGRSWCCNLSGGYVLNRRIHFKMRSK